jgi:hypothetical protein
MMSSCTTERLFSFTSEVQWSPVRFASTCGVVESRGFLFGLQPPTGPDWLKGCGACRCTYQLAINPDALAKVRAEGKLVFTEPRVPGGDDIDGLDQFSRSPLPGREDLNKLQYTLNCLKETLRLYTPVPIISRVAVNDDVIDGQRVPAGTIIFCNIKVRDTQTAVRGGIGFNLDILAFKWVQTFVHFVLIWVVEGTKL